MTNQKQDIHIHTANHRLAGGVLIEMPTGYGDLINIHFTLRDLAQMYQQSLRDSRRDTYGTVTLERTDYMTRGEWV